MQSLKSSLLESVLNVGSGFIISWIVGMFMFPAMGIVMSSSQNFIVVCVFTCISIVRGFIWRRIFNKLHTQNDIDFDEPPMV